MPPFSYLSTILHQQLPQLLSEVIEMMDLLCDSFSISLHYASKDLEGGEAEAVKYDFTTPLGIPSHTSPACKSVLLASVAAPRAHDESAKCLVKLAQSKALSPLQLDDGATLAAITRHNRLLAGKNQNTGKGILFVTYSLLVYGQG
jgi:hypothetical protein